MGPDLGLDSLQKSRPSAETLGHDAGDPVMHPRRLVFSSGGDVLPRPGAGFEIPWPYVLCLAVGVQRIRDLLQTSLQLHGSAPVGKATPSEAFDPNPSIFEKNLE